MQTGSTSQCKCLCRLFHYRLYSYFNLRCRIKASRVRDMTDYRQPLPLETPTFLSSKWLAIGDLRCMDEALLILLIIIH